MSETTWLRTCPLCEAACGLEITVRDGRPIRVRGDRDDPHSRGFICPKGSSLVALHDDPDRLRRPLVRRWKHRDLVEVGWDEAFAELDRRIDRFLGEHGRDALATYSGNPVAHNLSLLVYLPQVLRAVGSGKHFSSASVDVLPKQLACALMYGHGYSLPVPDVARTSFLLVLGANPLVSNGSMLTAPDMKGRLAALRARGGRLVVVDPTRTATADVADEHLPIRPGTDTWLLAALVRVLFAEHLVDLGALGGPAGRAQVHGVEAVELATRPFTPQLAAARTGIAAETIVRLARDLAAAPSAAVYGRVGTCLQEHGTLASWLIEALNVLTGNLDRPGGAVFTTPVTEPARAPSWLPSQETHHGRFRTRVRGLPEVFGELPAAALAEEILEPGEGRIRGLLVFAGNPALSVPGSAEVQRALAGLDLLVCVDNHLNETTRFADVVLPGESPLERPHFPFIARWAVDRYARWTPASIDGDRDGDRPHEWEVLLTLAALLGGDHVPVDIGRRARADVDRRVRREVARPGSPIEGRDPDEIAGALAHAAGAGPERVVDLLLRTGREGDGFGARPGGLSLDRLRAEPHGVNLGPAGPQLPGVLTTGSAAIELAPPLLLDELRALAAAPPPEPDPEHPLLLIGRRNLRSNNSWMHNIATLVRGRPQCTLQIHPDDARRRGVVDGAPVRVTSAGGAVEVVAEVTDALRPGVVSLPHGWGHGEPGSRLAVAATVPGANSNLLGDGRTVERVTATSVANGIPVEVRPAPRLACEGQARSATLP